ncbi:TPA: hypothetical protein ACT2LD_003806, partial [Escherichia coli]
IATNDVREQQTAVPPVPEIQDDVAQAIENLKQKLVECNRYNYCADAVKGVEDACHAAMLQGRERLVLDAATGTTAGGEVMNKCNALLYAMVIGFGLAAGIRVYITWESLINLAWSAIRG